MAFGRSNHAETTIKEDHRTHIQTFTCVGSHPVRVHVTNYTMPFSPVTRQIVEQIPEWKRTQSQEIKPKTKRSCENDRQRTRSMRNKHGKVFFIFFFSSLLICLWSKSKPGKDLIDRFDWWTTWFYYCACLWQNIRIPWIARQQRSRKSERDDENA